MASTLPKKEKIVEPYSRLAEIYDEVMSHVDYKHWAEYINKIIKRWNSAAHKVVDISCGTGSILFNLKRYNYRLFGFDLSFEMIKNAKEKIENKSAIIDVWQSNMQSFQLKQSADVVICIYDSINYLHKPEEIANLFNVVWQNLSDQGIFIFDICTARNSIDYFLNYFEQIGGKNYSYTRHSTYNKKKKIHCNRFEIIFDSEDKKYIEMHKQKIYAINEILSLIEDSNFSLAGFYDGFSFRQGSEKSYRIHFVLKKE